MGRFFAALAVALILLPGNISAQSASPTPTPTVISPLVSFTSSTQLTREGETFTVNFALSAAAPTAVTIRISVSGVASAGIDYDYAPGTLTIPAGAINASFQTRTFGDGIAEGTETIILALIGAEGALVNQSKSIDTISIADSGLPMVQWETTQALRVTEPLSKAPALHVEFKATRSSLSGPSSINYLIQGSEEPSTRDPGLLIPSASGGKGILTFPPGSYFATLALDVLGDDVDESTQSLTFAIQPFTESYSVGKNQKKYLSIVDSTPAPQVSWLFPSSLKYEGGGDIRITAVLNRSSNFTIYVPFNTAGTAGASDYYPLSSVITFLPGKTTADLILRPIFDGAGGEPDETVILTLAPFGSYVTPGSQLTHTLTIRDWQCTYTLNPPALFTSSAAQTKAVSLTTLPQCAWHIQSTSPSVTVAPSSGTGPANLTLAFSVNSTTETREANISVETADLPTAQFAGPSMNSARAIGAFNTTISAVAVHPTSGDIFIIGYFQGTTDFGGAALTIPEDETHLYLARYNSSLTLTWVKDVTVEAGFGMQEDQLALKLAISSSGEAAVAITRDDTMAGENGNSHIQVAKYQSDGTMLWSKATSYGITLYTTELSGVVLDSNGNVLISGTLTNLDDASFDFFCTSGLISKFGGSNGSISFNKLIKGDPSADECANAVITSIDLDTSNNIIIAGWHDDMDTFDFYDFLDKYTPSAGTRTWRKSFIDGSGSYIAAVDRATNNIVSVREGDLEKRSGSTGALNWSVPDLDPDTISINVDGASRIYLFMTEYQEYPVQAYSSTGNLLWGKSTGIGTSSAMAIDKRDNHLVFVGEANECPFQFDELAYLCRSSEYTDNFVLMMNP